MALQKLKPVVIALLLLLSGATFAAAQQPAASAPAGDTVLHAAEAAKVLPSAVFFQGQSAPVQARNSGGIRLADGAFVLAMLIDNSGYSTAVQQKYQAYFITETAIEINHHPLPAGAYGVGFVSGHFGVMDIGGHDLFAVDATHDAELKRPTPLQVLADAGAQSYRYYQGRDYVTVTRPR